MPYKDFELQFYGNRFPRLKFDNDGARFWLFFRDPGEGYGAAVLAGGLNVLEI